MSIFRNKILLFFLYLLYSSIIVSIPMLILRSGYFEIGMRFRYIFIYFVFIILLFLVNRIVSVRRSFWYLLAPILIFTIYGLWINAKDLFPFIFPAITLLFTLCILEYLFTGTKRRILFSFNIILILFFSFVIYPSLTAKKNIEYLSLPFEDIKSFNMLTPDGGSISLSNDKMILLDFMFLECKPCILKLNYLQTLKNLPISINIIVDGQIDKFEDFKKYYYENKEMLSGFTFLYDIEGRLSRKMKINTYPTELIIKNKNIILKDVGVPSDAKTDYFDIRKKILTDDSNDLSKKTNVFKG